MKTMIIHTFSYNYMCSIKTKEQIYIYIFYNNSTIFFLTSLLRIFIFININYLSLKIYHHAQKSIEMVMTVMNFQHIKKIQTFLFWYILFKFNYRLILLGQFDGTRVNLMGL